MRKILRSFTINEISAVRASAQEGAKAVIIKSHKPEDTQKMDNSLKAIAKQYGFPALAKHIADNGANISEAEFVAAGNEHYGKAEFTKMIANDATIYAACRKLNDAAIAKFEARWLPNTSGTARKSWIRWWRACVVGADFAHHVNCRWFDRRFQSDGRT